jgi:hypothetical protein
MTKLIWDLGGLGVATLVVGSVLAEEIHVSGIAAHSGPEVHMAAEAATAATVEARLYRDATINYSETASIEEATAHRRMGRAGGLARRIGFDQDETHRFAGKAQGAARGATAAARGAEATADRAVDLLHPREVHGQVIPGQLTREPGYHMDPPQLNNAPVSGVQSPGGRP